MNSSQLLDVSNLQSTLETFASERNWEQFHSPKNLAMALSGEVGELTSIFQWMTESQSATAASDANTAQAVRDELADVMIYLARLSAVLQIDLNSAVTEKIKKNAIKYPADKPTSK